jgi:predicted ester cyclase
VRTFEVRPGEVRPPAGLTGAAEVVAAFLARVRVTGDPDAARELMAPSVVAHQVVAEGRHDVVRTPEEYAAHVRDMVRAFGRFTFTVTELLAESDHVYVRWRQEGHHVGELDGRRPTGAPLVEVGSAVYRVADGRIAEYWVQLDRLGLTRQLDAGGQ